MAEIPSYLKPNDTPQAPVAPQVPGTSAHVDATDGVQPYEQVYDVRNNTTINIPVSEMEVAVRSGLYAPLKNKEFVVKDSDGNTHAVDGVNLKQAFDEGNTYASPEESHKHLINRKYGNSEILAALEGVERGALPGVSDRLLTGTKDFQGNEITQEDLAGRAEANPIAAGAGELIGTFISPLAKIPMGAAARTEAQMAKVLTKAGAKAGLSGKVAQAIVAKAIPKAAGSAVEGAYYGAAHLLNEDALGNAQFNAENLLSSVEQGALWGAAFGGGLSLAGSAVNGAAVAAAESRAGKYLGEKASDISKYVNNKAKATYEFLGITPAKARKLADKDPEFIDDAIKWTQETIEQNPKAGIGEVASKLNSDLDDVGGSIGKLYDDVDSIVSKTGKGTTLSKSDLKYKIAKELDDKIVPRFDGVEGMDIELNNVNKTINEIFEGAQSAQGKYSAKELHAAMRNVQEKINFEKAAAPAGPSLKQEMLIIQREVIRKELDNLVFQAAKANPAELADAATLLKQLNRRYRTLTSLEKAVNGRAFDDANSSILKGVADMTTVGAAAIDPSLGAAAVIGKKFLESDMLRKMQILGKIERAQQQTSAAIGAGFKAMSKGAEKVQPLVSRSLVSSALATSMSDGKKKKPSSEQEAYRNILANARFASENPEQFLQGVNRYSSHMYAVAPKTSGALDTAALNAMVYLHSKAPKYDKPKGLFDAGKIERVNGQDMLKLKQRMEILEKPTRAVELLKNGKLGATHVEALKTVYPQIYSEMQKQAMNFISSKEGQQLTYSQKLNLANLLDVQADESMHYENVLALQSNFNNSGTNEAEPAQGAVNTTQGGLAKINKADRVDTDTVDDSV